MTRIRHLMLALCCSISLILYLHRYTWGFIKKDVQDELGWDLVTLGWMDAFFSLTYGIGSIPSGLACDWFGARWFLILIILLWSLSLGWSSVATTKVSMAASRLFFGLTQSGCYPTLGKVSKNWFPLGNRTLRQSMITGSGRLGGALAFFIVGSVLMSDLGLSWRWALGVLTLLGVLLATAVLLLFGNSPAEHPWANQQEADFVTAEDPVAIHSSGSVLNWRHVVRSRNMWLLLGRAFLSNVADTVYVYWIPLYFMRVKGTDLSEAALNASLPLIGGAVGGIFSGWMQERLIRDFRNRRWARSSIGFASKFLAMGFIVSSLYFEDARVVAWVFFIVKFFGDWEGPVTWGTATDIGGKNSATVFGWINTMGSIAAVIAGPMTGLIIMAGWNVLFLTMALEYLGVAVIWLFINCTVPIEPGLKPAPDNK